MLKNQSRLFTFIGTTSPFTVPRGHRLIVDCIRFYMKTAVEDTIYLDINSMGALNLGYVADSGVFEGSLTFPNQSLVLQESETIELTADAGSVYGSLFGILEKIDKYPE